MFPFCDRTKYLSPKLLCMRHNSCFISAILCSLCKSVETSDSRDKNITPQRNVSILTFKGVFQTLLLKMLGFLQTENTDRVRLKTHWGLAGKVRELNTDLEKYRRRQKTGKKKKMKLFSAQTSEN